MARTSVRLSRARLASGELPAVCVITGRPTTHRLRMTFHSTPEWTWILLLFGILPFFVAAHFASEDIQAVLPVTRETVARYRVWRRAVMGTTLASVVLFAAAAGAHAPVAAWLGAAALVGAVAGLVVVNLWWVGVSPDRRSGELRLRRVHRAFARAVRKPSAA